MLSFSEFLIEKKNINLTHKEVSNHLKNTGWSLERTQGSHDIWKHEKAKNKIAVPRHRGDLAPGTVRSILKDSQVE
jgi:predicted RNA binding protein YcfA (HicA-like mRNA interferase family)